ncbi:MAG TPA: LacI family DNA-binding transcriptional regulator [Caulobacteraceae bacterium]
MAPRGERLKVTLHDVAARAQVSIATVSRVVNELSVSPASLARVRAAVAELGYVPNAAARTLRSERSWTMGLIFSDLRNTLGIELLDALSETIEAAGYSLIISTARGSAERYDELMRRFLERRVDALFCIRPPPRAGSLARYQAAGVPVMALFERSGDFEASPLVRPAFSEPGRALAQHLAGGGHAAVAVVRPPSRSPALAALTEALRDERLRVELVEPAESDGAREIVAGVLARPDRPTAIVAVDPLVRAVVGACHGLGVAIPGALSVVAVSDLAADAHYRRHGVSAVVIDPHRMGRASGAAMLAWLGGSVPAERIRVQAASFAARASSGPAGVVGG